MIVTYNWLKEFVECDLSTQELGDLLTMLGLEVEGVREVGGGLDQVVVAVVEERRKHPNADKLSLCKVNNGREILDIVCGAQNFTAGDKVALAQIGAVLPGDFKIKRSKIRGEESCGMLCSERELGLSAESEGIMILPSDLPLGVPLFDALGLKDTIFEIGLTPNRADCLSVIGVAREIAAKLGKRITYPGHAVVESGEPVTQKATVIVEDPELCPRYTARFISGCSIGPSPAWLVRRLEAVGMRSINNVVDVTNYVLMEYGHPLHAFDADLLENSTIVVRRATDGEVFTTLDGQQRTLTAGDLTIRDGARSVALAGIMGGENSEIRDTTTNILLESAYFNPSAIRRTAKRLGLHTESSHRFERGADVAIVTRALDRAAALLAELAGGTVAAGIIDAYPTPVSHRTIRFRVDRCNALLGVELSADEMKALFHHLEFTTVTVEPGIIDVTVPTFRVDLEREIDLVEEVARLNGYDRIETTMPRARVFSDRPTKHQRMERRCRDLMVGQGFNEVITFSFMAPGALDRMMLGPDDGRRSVVALRNPLVDEQAVMRTTLLPGLLEAASRNLNYRSLDLRLFELRRVYLRVEGEQLPNEPLVLAGLMTGRRYPEGWTQEKHPLDFYDVKGVVETVLDAFSVSGATYSSDGTDVFYHPGKSCTVRCGDSILGSLGELHPDVQDNFGIDQPVFYFELNFERLLSVARGAAAVVPPSRFPDTFRDIAMLVADETPAADIVRCIGGLRIREIESAAVFDLYKGVHVPEGKKSIAVRVRYRSTEKTLSDDEVSPLHQKVVDSLVAKLGATIR
ncbi:MULTISPECIES: phenylalanine--tRNA ligase subunit beta [Geobacter]|uniref:phenylalanine--tRNA ligase subunit beta n=1 Tax=Geobacter TaxID=28231 RepID=UPI00257390CB|nr:phenylalanine--tRNA ligase subunit beta [Geobacter sulfurreducens]BEH10499.1 phenylalanine--tRNA ligase subunit beta [Geobacter sulfurreducens subsp. ethanolicus]BET57892.1 phenylalanine--tRNA ligase subunit beta [Geobacter sp. 60473]HML78460.1 phenylalanine--tRNA ligase subunit beta [Geobacter sulfurreducens]